MKPARTCPSMEPHAHVYVKLTSSPYNLRRFLRDPWELRLGASRKALVGSIYIVGEMKLQHFDRNKLQPQDISRTEKGLRPFRPSFFFPDAAAKRSTTKSIIGVGWNRCIMG